MKSTRISRKEFLGMSALGGAGLMLAGRLPDALAAPMSLTPYMVELPIPPVAKADPADRVIRLMAQQSTQQMHPQLKNVTVWGYNQDVGKTTGYLGPTIELRRNNSTTVEFTNKLEDPHPYIPIAEVAPDGKSSFPGIDTRGTGPRILTHLHGGFVSGTNDGNPYATDDEYEFDETQQVTYPPHPRATTLWYHDHALGMTRLNVYAGLAGFLRMRDDFDTGIEPNPIGIPGNVPDGPSYEVPILLQDKTFSGGELFYSDEPEWIPEFFGKTPVVNGAVQPFLRVEPRMYRFIFLNGSQSRFYNLELAVGNNPGPTFYQIGSEGGMFKTRVSIDRILLLPAERADVIVDFGGLAGKNIELKNRSLPKGVVSPATPRMNSLMQFRVGKSVTTPGPQEIPRELAGGSEPDLKYQDPVKTRYITLEEVLDDAGEPLYLRMNGHRFEDRDDAGERLVDETPTEDTIEDWSFVNISADTHPIHMHLTNFQVMGRRPINGVLYAQDLENARAKAANEPLPFPARPTPPPLLENNTIDPGPYYVGPEVDPAANEKGWKDTVRANPNQVTRIRQMFELPEGAEGSPLDSPQRQYVYHCHILEHEDNDMMRPFKVVQ